MRDIVLSGDLATGSYTKSSIGVKRTQIDDEAMDCVISLIAVSGSSAAIPTSPTVVAAPPNTESATAVTSTPAPPLSVPPPVSLTTSSTVQPGVRPYVRRVRARPADPIPELIREIIQSQEKFGSRMTKYDKVIQIFQERFMFGLSTNQEMGFIALFSENPCMVDQFFSFNDAQRDIFLQARKLKE